MENYIISKQSSAAHTNLKSVEGTVSLNHSFLFDLNWCQNQSKREKVERDDGIYWPKSLKNTFILCFIHLYTLHPFIVAADLLFPFWWWRILNNMGHRYKNHQSWWQDGIYHFFIPRKGSKCRFLVCFFVDVQQPQWHVAYLRLS